MTQKIAYSIILFIPFFFSFLFNITGWFNNLINTILVIFFSSLFFFLPKNYSKKNILITLIFICITILNYLITDYASLKYLINSFAFFLIFFMAYHVSYSVSQKDLIYINNHSFKILEILIVSFILIILSGLFFFSSKIIELFYYMILEKKNLFPSIFFLYSKHFYLEKAYVAIVITFLIFFFYFYKNKITKIKYSLFLTSFFSIFFIWSGIRSLFFSLILFLLILFIIKNKFRFLLCSLFFLLLLSSIFLYIDEYKSLFEEYFDRAPSFKGAFHVLNNHIFGIGNGGYTNYVNDNIIFLTDTFRPNGYWTAAESDIVYYIASWGCLSLFFILLSIYIIFMTASLLVHNGRFLKEIDKIILTTTSILILMGISQDYAFQIFWFIYVGFSLGTIDRIYNKI